MNGEGGGGETGGNRRREEKPCCGYCLILEVTYKNFHGNSIFKILGVNVRDVVGIEN